MTLKKLSRSFECLENTVKGHKGSVNCIEEIPDSNLIATGSEDKIIKLWDVYSGTCVKTLCGHKLSIRDLSIVPDSNILLSASTDGYVFGWDIETGKKIVEFNHNCYVFSVAAFMNERKFISGSSSKNLKIWDLDNSTKFQKSFGQHIGPVMSLDISPDGNYALSCSWDSSINYWDLKKDKLIGKLKGHVSDVYSVQFSLTSEGAISCSEDMTVKLWNTKKQVCRGTLEGHFGGVSSISQSKVDRIIATSSNRDKTVRVWDINTGGNIAIIQENDDNFHPTIIAFHTESAKLVVGTTTGQLFFYSIKAPTYDELISNAERYSNAKIVLVGESGVGKSGLAHRLIKDQFIKTKSSHGMNVWRVDLPFKEEKGIHKEALLWDLAGQEDYRLIHQLFLDETALALVLFNPQKDDPFSDVVDWVKALQAAINQENGREALKLLIGARIDVGNIKVSLKKIERFMKEHGFIEYLPTSALTGENCSDTRHNSQASPLKQLLLKHIPWESLPWTSTTKVLRELKNAVIALKEENLGLLRFRELERRLTQEIHDQEFGEMDVRTAIALLANHGLVIPFKFGDIVLLYPEILNSYAASVIRSARSHIDEIGCVSERDIFEKKINFDGFPRLPSADEDLLLRAMIQMFLDKSLCIAEDTPGGRQLIFPSQYRRERPLPTHPEIFVSYTFSGELATVYTTLVVRLWYSREFDNKELWKNAAEFFTATGMTVGFTLKKTNEGEGTLSIFFETEVPVELKVVFLEYVHQHLQKYALELKRDRRYFCQKCGRPVRDIDAIRENLIQGRKFVYCINCGERIHLIDSIEKRLKSDPVARKVLEMERKARSELDNQAKEQILEGHMMAICGQANQIYRDISKADYGIDGEIEFRDMNGTPTGTKIYVQLKSGKSHLRERKSDGKKIFDVKNKSHLDYWQNQPVDLYLVILNGEGTILWMNVTQYLTARIHKESRQIEFDGEKLDADSLLGLRDTLLNK